MSKHNLFSKDPIEIRKMWYIPSYPCPKSRWILYSKDFIMQALQGCYGYPERINRHILWRVIGEIIWMGAAVFQLIFMFLCIIPILAKFIQMVVKASPRNAIGFFLRGCYWKTKLRYLGMDTLIDEFVEINRPDLVEIGSCCHLDRNVLLSVGNDSGEIVIGNHVFFGPDCHIAGRGGVEIHDYAALAADVHIYSVTNVPYHVERMGELISMSHTLPATQQSTIEGRVMIGKYAVIGFNSLIMPGVSLGTGAIVHAFSEVIKSFPDFAVVSGHGRGRQQGWRRPGAIDPRLRETESHEADE